MWGLLLAESARRFWTKFFFLRVLCDSVVKCFSPYADYSCHLKLPLTQASSCSTSETERHYWRERDRQIELIPGAAPPGRCGARTCSLFDCSGGRTAINLVGGTGDNCSLSSPG